MTTIMRVVVTMSGPASQLICMERAKAMAPRSPAHHIINWNLWVIFSSGFLVAKLMTKLRGYTFRARATMMINYKGRKKSKMKRKE